MPECKALTQAVVSRLDAAPQLTTLRILGCGPALDVYTLSAVAELTRLRVTSHPTSPLPTQACRLAHHDGPTIAPAGGTHDVMLSLCAILRLGGLRLWHHAPKRQTAMCCSPAESQQLKHVTLEPRIHKKQQDHIVERLAAPQILVLGGVPSALHQSLFDKICALPHLQSLSLAVNAKVCLPQAMRPQADLRARRGHPVQHGTCQAAHRSHFKACASGCLVSSMYK